MFLDASAIVAILAREPSAERLKTAIDRAETTLYVSPLAVFEASVSLARAKRSRTTERKPPAEAIRAAHAVVAAFIEANAIEELVITSEVAQAAIEAAATYGKAVGHEADLNFGDCFAYACAKTHRLRLLYQGHDFAKTDLG